MPGQYEAFADSLLAASSGSHRLALLCITKTWMRERMRAGRIGGTTVRSARPRMRLARVNYLLLRQFAFGHLLPCVLHRAQSGGALPYCCLSPASPLGSGGFHRSPGVRDRPVTTYLGLSSAATAGVVKVFGHRVLATGTQGLAAQQPPACEQAATPGAESNDGNPCIIGATGVEAASLSQQGAEPALVASEQKKQYSSQDNSRYRNSLRYGDMRVFQKRACWCSPLGL